MRARRAPVRGGVLALGPSSPRAPAVSRGSQAQVANLRALVRGDPPAQLVKLKSDPSVCVAMLATQMPGDDQCREVARLDVRRSRCGSLASGRSTPRRQVRLDPLTGVWGRSAHPCRRRRRPAERE
jgi:hypothetical protein